MTLPPTPGHPTSDNWHGTDPWISFGKKVVLWFFGGLIVWSALISISSAVVTGGTVTVETSYQEIQSLEGGVVAQIPVKNGEVVKKGQTLLLLDDTSARANMSAINARVNDLLFKEARLSAERDGAQSFAVPKSIRPDSTNARKAFAAQSSLFKTRLKIRTSTRSMLDERLVQLERELTGLKAQYAARAEQRKINETELAAILPLYERGYVSQQRLGPLKRESARLAGEIGRLDAEIGKIGSSHAEARLRKDHDEKQFLSEVVAELGSVQASLAEEQQSLTRLKAILARTHIKSPRAGRVHALTVSTIGGVIAPGARLMQVIPQGERLVVEAKLEPRQVDRVRPGQTAAILFPAFNSRTTPRLQGTVSKISPAEQTDPDGRTYFSARIEINSSELAKIAAGHRLVPGMPAEIFIETGARSILSYLFKPLTDTMGRALRER